MADLHFPCPAIDYSERLNNWHMLGDPGQVNDGAVGLARLSTCRSCPSQPARGPATIIRHRVAAPE